MTADSSLPLPPFCITKKAKTKKKAFFLYLKSLKNGQTKVDPTPPL
jgi:hypothetical protein